VTNAGVAVWVTPGAFGWTADELARESETIAACVKKCWSVEVTPGQTPGVAQLDFRFRDPLAELVPFSALPAPLPGRLTLGINDQGEPVYIFNHLSILIVGQLGSGKSNALWNLIMQALASSEPFSLWVIDPSGGVELHALSLGSPIVKEYAAEAGPIRRLIRNLHREMLNRMRGMAGKSRFHVPTVEEPRWYLVIDEMVRLGNILEREDNDLLIEILSMCRKAGITVVALTQIPFAHTMGEKVRLLFPQKVVFRANDLMITNSIFGAGAESLGAKASKISAATPGIAYAVFERTNRPMRLRGPAQDEHSISLIAQGVVPEGVAISEGFIGRDVRNVSHVVYQFITDDGEILYIGISNDGTRRLAEHLSSEKRERLLQPDVSWRPLLSLDVESCAPEIASGKTVREVAEEIEKTLIQEHQPVFNIAHAGNGKKSRRRKPQAPQPAPPPQPDYWVEQVVDESSPPDGPRAITDGTSE
jgi:predicted GIY-YIG superfamily endonuclease